MKPKEPPDQPSLAPTESVKAKPTVLVRPVPTPLPTPAQRFLVEVRQLYYQMQREILSLRPARLRAAAVGLGGVALLGLSVTVGMQQRQGEKDRLTFQHQVDEAEKRGQEKMAGQVREWKQRAGEQESRAKAAEEQIHQGSNANAKLQECLTRAHDTKAQLTQCQPGIRGIGPLGR